MPAGRPSKYDPAYCKRVIEYGEQGMSVVEMAHKIGVARNTLETEWPKQHPEFLEALTYAREASQAWWEAIGRDNMTVPGFNAAVWSRSMASRFPRDWTERKQTEIAGTLQVEQVHSVDPALLSAEQLVALKSIAQLMIAPPVIEGDYTEVDEGEG